MDYETIKAALINCGLSDEEAHTAACIACRNHLTVQPMTHYGGLHPEDIGRIWDQARQHGAKSMVLKVELEPDDYHTSVLVLARNGTVVPAGESN